MKKIIVLSLAVGMLVSFGSASFAQSPSLYLELEKTVSTGFDTSNYALDVGASSTFYISVYAKNVPKFLSYQIDFIYDRTKIPVPAGTKFVDMVFVPPSSIEQSPIYNASKFLTSSGDVTSTKINIAQSNNVTGFEGVDIGTDWTFLGRVEFTTDATFTIDDSTVFQVTNAMFGTFVAEGADPLYVSVALGNVTNAGLNTTSIPVGPPALTTAYVATTGDDSTGDGSQGSPFATITKAITEVEFGGTINVVAGTYTEDLTIGKRVTLQGAGSGSVTVTGTHTITTDNVTVDGFTFGRVDDGVIITVDTQTGGDITGCSFTNNIFDFTNASIGIWLGNAAGQTVSTVSITGNTFSGPDTKIANPIRIGGWFGGAISAGASDVNISNNTMDKCSMPIGLEDIDISGITFDGNTFTNTDGCVYVWDENDGNPPTGVLSDFVFTNNTVDSTNSYGITFGLNNTFTDANFGTGIVVNSNKFEGTFTNAYSLHAVSILSNVTTYTVDAESNWWGDATGPTHASNVGGTGAPVSDNVDFSPWYEDEAMTTLAALPAPVITVEPTSLNFDSVNVDSSKSLPVLVINTGDASLNVDSVQVPDGFSIDPQDSTGIAVGDTVTFTVTFTPQAGGEYTDSLMFFSNDITTGTVAVNVHGTATVTAVISGPETAPGAYRLGPNYPNPFNPTTNIPFELKMNGRVTITVYNLLGQKVAEVVNDYYTAGNHIVLFDASDLGSGIYFYRMEANGFTSTRKFVYIR